jgi:hypothetical protein
LPPEVIEDAPTQVAAPRFSSPHLGPSAPGSTLQSMPDIQMTRRMPSAPPTGTPSDHAMGGFILRPRVNESPSGRILPDDPNARSWTGVIVAGAIGAVFLWLVIVIVLRVVLR